MKPAPFAYFAPRELAAALRLLAEHGDEAKVLAGGQSLVPMMNFRLIRPSAVIDVNRLGSHDRIAVDERGLRIGAFTRVAQLERTPVVAARWPLLAEAAALVGHPAIRNRGTVGGSAAHADPHAELPAVLCALDATFVLRSLHGERSLGAGEFFRDFYTTALEPNELLLEITVPPLPAHTGTAVVEHAQRHGDFALAGAAAVVTLDGTRCVRVAIGVLGAHPTPLRATAAEAALTGSTIDDETARAAGGIAAASCDPPEPADFRRALVAELTRRALLAAARRAA